MIKPREINVLTLAYLGDSIYENYIRLHLINRGTTKVNDLQKNAVNYVSARAQSQFLKALIEKNIFNEEEMSIIMRARNHKSKSKPKHASAITYKHATALEAVIGFLYLENKLEKINQIMNFIVGE